MRDASLLMHVFAAAKRGKRGYVPKQSEESSVPALMREHLIEYIGPAKSGKRSAYRITVSGSLRAKEYMKDMRRCAPPERPVHSKRRSRWSWERA